MSDYQQLLSQIEELKQQAESIRKEEVKKVIADIKGMMEQYGITAAQLASATRSAKGAAVAAKYRHPSTGQSWTGRGRAPRWVLELEAAGTPRASFHV